MKKVVVIIVIAVLLSSSLLFISPQLFQGQLLDGPEDQTTTEEEVSNLQSDLIPEMELEIPEDPLQDIVVNATIRNSGEGALSGDTPFTYSIYMNEKEVFSNSDSYTSMEPGDEFSFSYPISRAIYGDDSGKITFKVDSENSIEESNEDNNEVVKEFSI